MIVQRSNEIKEPHSIFLAGPTHRVSGRPSWREDAIDFFKKKEYNGRLFIPEPFAGNYVQQIDWEEYHLEIASCIMFWIPRDMKELPALTTNIEFGEWMKSGKVVLGYPHDAVSMDYLAHKAHKYGVPTVFSLEETVRLAIIMAKRKLGIDEDNI